MNVQYVYNIIIFKDRFQPRTQRRIKFNNKKNNIIMICFNRNNINAVYFFTKTEQNRGNMSHFGL